MLTYTVGQKVTLGDGTVGTVGELTTAENGAKFYKVVRNDGTIDWLPADAENAKGTVDKAMDVAMNAGNKWIVDHTEDIPVWKDLPENQRMEILGMARVVIASAVLHKAV